MSTTDQDKRPSIKLLWMGFLLIFGFSCLPLEAERDTWFARGGALLIAFTLLFVSSQMFGQSFWNDHRKERNRRLDKHRQQSLDRAWGIYEILAKNERSPGEQQIVLDYAKKRAELLPELTLEMTPEQKYSQTLFLVEWAFLIIGTIQWGYGDLLYNLVICGASSC